MPYLMSSHPGCTLNDAVDLAVFLKKHNIRPEQVQDFYPTPGTISTAMFYTGLDPYTMEPVYVPRKYEEKQLQRALLQYYKKENRELVEKALTITGRKNLIGSGADCLIPAAAAGRKNGKYAQTGGANRPHTPGNIRKHGGGAAKTAQKKKHR